MMIVAEKEGIARAARGPVADCLAASPLPPLNSRHRRLHNFSFPTLSWRGQRFLRCSKLPGDATAELPGSANRDNRTSQMKSSPPRPLPGFWDSKEGERRGSQGREAEKDNYCAKAAAEATRPWNLRTRRAACNAPTDRALAMEKIKSPVKTMRLRSDESEKGETRKFSISLSRPEIEEDFFAIKGRKLPRRPKKRAKIVQRELDVSDSFRKNESLLVDF
ncbi:hypothetical protein B296_00000790 [Ensete ventricosum]|uniref:Uncharacterized protein n=1 Tax=Ensete ventricosum TaxID=4639 RepID=A0A427B9W9_ENSVE|nr:hypothetical protein B296_00000790 [Ensete ventricosum]